MECPNFQVYGGLNIDKKDIKTCILVMEGTNCENETKKAFEYFNVQVELVHLKQLSGEVPSHKKRDLLDYHILMIPGGFSAGDYVRAGAIMAARIKRKLERKINEFVEDGRAIGGICNGFQVLVELGLLPGNEEGVHAALAPNENVNFECRPVILIHEENRCVFTSKIKKKMLTMPIAHAEGRFTLPIGREEELLQSMIKNRQIVFRYGKSSGTPADGEYPWNPNGSFYDIAGICNPKGNVFGLMPHPERVFFPYQMYDWSRSYEKEGDGFKIFESLIEYIANNF
ncbi:MAG: phosphoribosylformylglycinamidine synthase subunit PurQ [Candidatus Hydrothermarchaeota archaeon]